MFAVCAVRSLLGVMPSPAVAGSSPPRCSLLPGGAAAAVVLVGIRGSRKVLKARHAGRRRAPSGARPVASPAPGHSGARWVHRAVHAQPCSKAPPVRVMSPRPGAAPPQQSREAGRLRSGWQGEGDLISKMPISQTLRAYLAKQSPNLRCLRCGYCWWRKQLNPGWCAGCRSKLWNVPRVRAKGAGRKRRVAV